MVVVVESASAGWVLVLVWFGLVLVRFLFGLSFCHL